eukprot:6057480-Pyramimonas_sp.AAC.1
MGRLMRKRREDGGYGSSGTAHLAPGAFEGPRRLDADSGQPPLASALTGSKCHCHVGVFFCSPWQGAASSASGGGGAALGSAPPCGQYKKL